MVRPEHAPPGRDCSLSFEQPPAFAELVDSAAVHADLIRRWPDLEHSGAPLGQAHFTIHVDSLGEVRWIEVISSDLAANDVAYLSGLLRGGVKTRTTEGEDGPRREGWIQRIGLGIGPSFSFMVGRPVYCLPRVRNAQQISARLNDLLDSPGVTVGRSGQSAVLWILPGEAGRALRIEVSRSSGSVALDQIAQQAVSVGYFEPAIADGRPMDRVWISFPINFTPRPRRQPR